jgi:hypothetical protein
MVVVVVVVLLVVAVSLFWYGLESQRLGVKKEERYMF